MLNHDPPLVVVAFAVQLTPETCSDCGAGSIPPATPWKLSDAGATVKCGATHGGSATCTFTVCDAGSAPIACTVIEPPDGVTAPAAEPIVTAMMLGVMPEDGEIEIADPVTLACHATPGTELLTTNCCVAVADGSDRKSVV